MNNDPAFLKDLAETAVRLAVQSDRGPFDGPAELTPLAHGGSHRGFYRISDGIRSAVVLSQPGAGEFERYVEIGAFLRKNGVGVPEFYNVDRQRGVLLMEDLGGLHLEDWLEEADPGSELALYRMCIEMLVLLETAVTAAMKREGFLEETVFDEKTLLGETEYFAREFIDGYCPVRYAGGWESERTLLAGTLAGRPRLFMHRDFQCRNIIVKDGKPRLIDFQAAHRGPGLYDAASLLKDPYHPLDREARIGLLAFFHDRLKEAGAPVPPGFGEYAGLFVLAGIQRNLQALAAFARLGLREGKRHFLRYIPAGVRLLEEGIEEAGCLPALKQMVTEIGEKISKGIE